MSLYYDRQGNPITMATWAETAEDISRKRVAEATVGRLWVSTVWLGLDHGFGDGPPLIFETMIFAVDGEDVNWTVEYCERYSTEAATLAGHERAVAWAGEHQPEVGS